MNLVIMKAILDLHQKKVFQKLEEMGKQDGKIMLKEIWKAGKKDILTMLKIIHLTNFIYWDLKT